MIKVIFKTTKAKDISC